VLTFLAGLAAGIVVGVMIGVVVMASLVASRRGPGSRRQRTERPPRALSRGAGTNAL